MVNLDLVKKTNSSLIQSGRPLVAVFTGGTSGIGEYTLRALAVHHGKEGPGLRLYIVGRNKPSAERIIADCRTTCPQGDFRFVQAGDLSLLKEVDRCSEEVSRLEREAGGADARIDFLVMSHADLHFGARRDTEEGIDQTMSLLYYSRMRFIVKLLPLLQASKHQAHVVSIYGAGLEKGLPRWYPDDLSLRDQKHYSLLGYRTHVPIMTTLFFEELAKQSPDHVSFSHIFPNLVITPAFYSKSMPWWFRALFAVLGPILARVGSVSPAEIGERVLFLFSGRFPARPKSGELEQTSGEVEVAISTDQVSGGGAYSVNWNGETNDVGKLYEQLRKELGSRVWDHTRAAFSAVDEGVAFSG